MDSRNYGRLATPPRAAGLGTFGRIVLIVVTATIGFVVFNPPRSTPFDPPPVVNSNSSPRAARTVEFEALYESAKPLARLSRPGRYTVVEVYIDNCIYCREIEAAFGPFNKQRADVSLFRVHHPGEIRAKFDGISNEDVQQQYEAFAATMESYGFCATPHIEVYGPNREPLARDSCTSRDGTAFMWDWITHETGIESRLSLKGPSSLRESPTYMIFIRILFGILVVYFALLGVQDRLENGNRWWHSKSWLED